MSNENESGFWQGFLKKYGQIFWDFWYENMLWKNLQKFQTSRQIVDKNPVFVYIKCRCIVYKKYLKAATETKKDQIWIKRNTLLSTGVSSLFQMDFWF